MGEVPSCSEVVAKAVLHVIGMIFLVAPMAYIYVIAATYEPYHRGFFCDDQNLKHPYREQTIPILTCFVIWACISIFLILLVETLRSLAERGRAKPIKNNRTPWIAVELYRQFGHFALGALSCLLFTEIAKYTIGRLRPHFLTVCNPDLTDELCKDDNQFYKFVEMDDDIICRGLVVYGGNYTEKELHEARLSFLSGHSSFSFFCATFLVVYLQARLANFPQSKIISVRIIYRTLKVLRPFIQFGLIILAFYIALTRISDYFHHPMDVVTGAFVGMLFAIVTLLFIADIFNKKSAFWINTQLAAQPAAAGAGGGAKPETLVDMNKADRKPALAESEDFHYIDEELTPRGPSSGSYMEPATSRGQPRPTSRSAVHSDRRHSPVHLYNNTAASPATGGHHIARYYNNTPTRAGVHDAQSAQSRRDRYPQGGKY